MKAAETELQKIYTPWKQAIIKAAMANAELGNEVDSEHFEKFMEAMRDDMNTPNAYAEIFEVTKLLNQSLRVREIDWALVGKWVATLDKMLDVLGIVFDKIVVTEEDKEVYNKWNEAKKAKDFEEADKYRLQLMEKGLL